MKIKIVKRRGDKHHYGSESGCTGAELAIAGAALAAGGTGAQMYGASKEQGAMNSAVQNELNRQAEFQKKGQQDLAAHQAQTTPVAVNKDIAQGAQNAQTEYGKLASVPVAAAGAASPTMNQSVGDTRTAERSKQSNAASAGLQGYTDWGVKQAIQNLQAKTALTQNSMFAHNSESVLPIELQAASRSQSGLMGLGSLASTAGSLLGLYGMTRPTAGIPTAAQTGALGAGYGPVSAGYANTIPAPITAGGNLTWGLPVEWNRYKNWLANPSVFSGLGKGL